MSGIALWLLDVHVDFHINNGIAERVPICERAVHYFMTRDSDSDRRDF